MDLITLGFVGLIATLLFFYQNSRLQDMQSIIDAQDIQLAELHRASGNNALTFALQRRLEAVEIELAGVHSIKQEIVQEISKDVSQEVESTVRALLLDSQGHVNWIELASNADLNPSAETSRKLALSIEDLEKRMIVMTNDHQFLTEHSLLLTGPNTCVLSALDGCPHNMVASTRFALGNFQRDGKVLDGFQESGTFNDNGWTWLQGLLCCSRPLP